MNFRQITWGVGLLGALALLGCGGDDTPTPTGLEGEAGLTGAGGAGNDASTSTDGSTGKAGGTGTDSGGVVMACKKTEAMAVNGQDINSCKGKLEEAGADGGGVNDSGVSCATCLCNNCPAEAMNCGGDPKCATINNCCRAACSQCGSPASEAGSDAPTSEGGNSDAASTTDSPAGDGATE